jgi:2-oxoglutarate dehydrogenase E2 component (dihydrolipoamide succinyltransferase)
LIPVGQIVIVISLGTDVTSVPEPKPEAIVVSEKTEIPEIEPVETEQSNQSDNKIDLKNTGRFYSPLVKSIATKEGVTLSELESITGSGLGGRVQKNDIVSYVEQRSNGVNKPSSQVIQSKSPQNIPVTQSERPKVSVSIGAEDTILKMDRIRKLIANHMVMSKQVSPHVTTVVEADVTNLVLWRNAVKNEFEKKYGEKLTFMPLFAEATAKALSEFRQVNSSVDEDTIILRKHINIAIAVATNDGNLVVPVIKDADSMNLVGLSREINSFARAGRENKLSPDDLQGGTFTITNFGSFGGLIGTPIINQPQVAILAVGMIEKKPAVMETPTGDAIVVRHKMFLSLSYDHRVVDGMLGGRFLRRIADLLEQFEQNTNI